MTVHSDVKYKCESCDTPFVPIPQAPHCPKCNRKSEKVFPDFIRDTLESAKYNLGRYGKWMTIWSVLSAGDFYYYWAFQFFDYACSRLELDGWAFLSMTFSREQADTLVAEFLIRLKFDREPYWRNGLAPYLSLLLQDRPPAFSSC